MTEERAQRDLLFVGMTRPPLTMGVPMEFFGINFMLFGMGMILFTTLTGKALFLVCVVLPLHAVGYLATQRDPHWMRVWLTKCRLCPPVPNRRIWKSNSYQP